MTGRTSSQNSDSSKAGTSKNALLRDASKRNTTSTGDDVHDKWSQSTVSFDFDKMHTDDFPNFLNDDFSIHKNDEALLADFTALLEDGDDPMMATANTSTKDKEKETNKTDADMSTSTSLNSSVAEILVTTDMKQSSEQLSQSIGSIMSDHDYLSREDILDIMNNDEENFFSQGFPKPMKIENDSMDVNLSGNVAPTLLSQQPIETNDSAAVATVNSPIDAHLPTAPANVTNDVAKTILADEVTPLLVKLTTTESTERENLIETIGKLEEKIMKLKKTVASSSDESNDNGETTTSDRTNECEKPGEPNISESESDAVFSCDRSEPLEYYGIPKGQSASTTDESDDEFVFKLKTELNTADALNDETRLNIKLFRRDIAPSTAQAISIKFATHLERLSADLLKIAEKFKSSPIAHPSKEASNEEGLVQPQTSTRDPNSLNEISKEQLLAKFSSSSSSAAASSSDDEGNDVPRIKRKKKPRGNKADPNLSQINSIDDEDNILVKNEPLLDSQHHNGNTDAANKSVDVIAELNKWKDYENEGEFYGFNATDTDDCANSSIDICVKNEVANCSIAISESARKLDDSEATQEYSVVEEIAKVNATKSSDTENRSNASEDANTIESTKELAEVMPIITSADDDEDKAEEVNKALDSPLPNGNDLSSENDASDEGGDDEDDDDDDDENDNGDADEDNDREIARLLDFSSLGVKRKISPNNNAPSKVNGIDEPKKMSKKQKKDDDLDAILCRSHGGSDDSDDSSNSENDEITEEQYLKQHNLNLKNQLLADTSSDSEYDSELNDDDGDRPIMNGTHKKAIHSDEDDESDENSIASGSYESLVDKFLEKSAVAPIESPKKKSTNDLQWKSSTESEDEKSDVSSSSKSAKSKSPPEINGSIPSAEADPVELVVADEAVEVAEAVKAAEAVEAVEAAEAVDAVDAVKAVEAVAAPSSEKEAENSDKDDNESVDQSSETTDTPKRKSKIGANVFSNIDKELRPLISSDDSDDNEDDSSKSKKKASSDESSDCEVILDTSLFKNRKKEIDSKQLSKILINSAKAKATTLRATPDDCISLSSDDELEVEPISVENAEAKEASDDDEDGKKNRTGRKLLRTDQLAGETKRAQREETDRIKRLEKKQVRLTQIIESQREQSQSQRSNGDGDGGVGSGVTEDIILDYDSKKKENIIVHRDIQKHLKSHQTDGIKFMYDCCYGSVDSLKDHSGSGCILAHCMGLGKTLQLISLLHTVITYPQLKTNKVLVICPKSTVLNWKEEIERWMGPIKEGRRLKLFQFADQSDIKQKMSILKDWSRCGKATTKAGCLLLGYEAFRTLVFYHTQKKALNGCTPNELSQIEKCVYDCLLKRGATDLVICDEGHMIKNQKSTTSLAVNKIETDRRIILTGTPIQNNLKEYYSMVNFIKPSFLGTEKEFNNLYGNPIKCGQHKDSSKQEIKVMKQRSYVLHNKLSKFVQRREAALLKTFLPEKYEYVIFIPMTDVQNRLYEYFLENNPLKDKLGGKSLISDYTILRKIWTHPKVLENAYLNALREEDRKKDRLRRLNNDEDEDERPDDFLDSQEGKMSVKNDWWRPHVTKEDLETILPSNKLKILFEILKVCRENGEKCLIFSAFVAVLDVVEFFMKAITKQTQEGATYNGLENYRGIWKYAEDYYRLDGKTPRSTRHQMITNFNDPKNQRARVFLISAKAGGQGINLTGANRVILLDTSWNPSNDQQNIFRVFRLGQKKICYIYRLLAMGTMEEKVYSRSVTKQAMSCRVVDEQQIDRHYNMAELTELYVLVKPDYSQRPTPPLPIDKLLAHLLHKFPNMLYKYHEHDSLLERNNEQDLSEADKADAWAAYEKDVTMRNTLSNMGTYNPNFNMTPGAYDNNFASYNSLFSTAFGGSSYGANTSMMAAYLSQLSSTAYPNPEYQELMRMYNDSYPNPYGNYSGMYSGNASAAANLYNAALMSSPPPQQPPTTPSSATSPAPSMLGYNQISSRNMLNSSTSATTGYNATSNFLSSLVQSPSTSKNYANSLLNNPAMQMYMNPYSGSNSGGGRIPAPVSSPLTSTSKSPATTTSSLYDPAIFSYLQQNSLLFGNPATTTASSATTSPNAAANTTGGNGVSGSNGSSRQGPNAKRNPMLSKELSMMSSRTPFFDPLNLPSIQTSVITKSPVNLTATTTSTSTTTTAAATGDTSSKKDQRLMSPEPHLIVKNVNAINQTVARSSTPSGAPMLNKNSVSITSINKKPNPETSSTTSSNASSNHRSSNSTSSTTATSSTGCSNISSSGSSSSGGASNSNSRTTSVSNTSADKLNASSRGASNMGIVYPDKDRVNETNKPMNSPTPKPGNIGIVYPPTPTRKNDGPTPSTIAQNQLNLMNSKNLAIPTSRSTPVETPMTALATVNKVLQQQNQRRTSPNAPQQITTKPNVMHSMSNTSATPSPTYPRKIMNSSVTVTPVTVPTKPATSPATHSPNTKSATGLSLTKRPFNMSTASKTNLSNSITLSPIPPSPTGPQYKTFGRPVTKPSVNSPTPDKDVGGKNSPKIVLSKPNATWQSRNNAMTISKTSVPAAVVTTAPSPSQNKNNGVTVKPRILTMSAKTSNHQQQQQQQQRSSPVIVRNSPSLNQSVSNRRTISSPTTVRRVIVGNGLKQTQPQIAKSVPTTPIIGQTSAPRPMINSKSITINKLPTLKNDSILPNSMLNRKRTGSPMPARSPNTNVKEMVGSNSVSITQVKKAKLSLPSSSTRPPPMVRTIGVPMQKSATGSFQNIRILPRQSSNNISNNSPAENSQRNVQDISTMEIVELD